MAGDGRKRVELFPSSPVGSPWAAVSLDCRPQLPQEASPQGSSPDLAATFLVAPSGLDDAFSITI